MKFLHIPLLALFLSTAYGNSDLEGYTRLDGEKTELAQITIEDQGFEKGGAGWSLKAGAKVEPGTGRSATRSLRYERTDSKDYKVISTKVNVTPGAFYRFGVWVKTENVTVSPQGGGATAAMQFSKTDSDGKKKFISGRYLKGLTGTNDWTLVSDTVRIPKDATTAEISLYIWKGATGTAWFDDIVIQKQDSNLWALYTLNLYNTITDGKCTVAVSHDGKTVSGKPLEVRMSLKDTTFIQRMPVQNDRAGFSLTEIPSGRYEAQFMLLDTAARTVLYSTEIPLEVAPPAAPAVSIDHLGRTFVNGKPFMPLGIFTGELAGGQIDKLKEAGFNCALPYSSMYLKTGKQDSPEEIVKVMDMAAAKGFKVIFSCKDVGSTARHGLHEWHGARGQDEIITQMVSLLKDHPALLAWYINDEQPVSQIPRLAAMRRQINRLDPNHPVYGALYQYEELPLYGPSCDIIGVDPYPLKAGNKTMANAVFAMKQARLSGLPTWVVPQISNIAVYYTDKQIQEPVNPSEEGMRSLVILEAAYGAKSFIFYKLEDLWTWKLPKDNYTREWPKVKNVVAMLKTLEPYIMSEYPVELLEEGEVVAARLRDSSGKSAILVCSIGPGPAVASLKLEGNFRSQYGRTAKQAGAWVFKGEDISSDLLFEE